jgi:porin
LNDLNKIAGMKGAEFHVSMSQRSGTSLTNEYIDNAFNVQQVYGGETFKLIDVEFIQRFCDNRLSFHGGRMAAGDDFLCSPYYWFFMQNGIDGNPVGIFKNAPGMTAYPNSTWGARLRARPSDECYLMAGVYNGDASIRDNEDHGVDCSLNGPAFVIGEVGYQINGHVDESGMLGTYKAGSYYDGNSFDNFNKQVLGDSASMFGVNSETRTGNWGYYFTGDQVIHIIEREKRRGIGVFGVVIVSPDEEYSTMPFFCNGGVIWNGPFASRPIDAAGFAVIYGEFSNNLRNAQKKAKQLDPSVEVQGGEMAFEWSYRIRMRNNSLYFQPDIQYIVHPNGYEDVANAFVIGAQMGVNF